MSRQTKRRALLGAIGAGLAAPRFVFAQAARVPTVAVLYAGDSDDDEPTVRPFFEQMGALAGPRARTSATTGIRARARGSTSPPWRAWRRTAGRT